jgi:hypothetical protein
MFGLFKNKTKTNVKVLITNHLNWHDVKQVYDVGNGAFIYSHVGQDIRYLRSDGTFMNNEYRTCNGDAKSWESHIGDVSTLKFKDLK